MPSVTRIVIFVIIMAILAIPMGLLEVALGNNFPAWRRWKMDAKTKFGLLKTWMWESRFSYIFAGVAFVINPIIWVIGALLSYIMLLVDVLDYFTEKPVDVNEVREVRKKKHRSFQVLPSLKGRATSESHTLFDKKGDIQQSALPPLPFSRDYEDKDTSNAYIPPVDAGVIVLPPAGVEEPPLTYRRPRFHTPPPIETDVEES